MPLFFILSCLTFKLSRDNEQFVIKTKKAFRHLAVPAFALGALRIAMVTVRYTSFEGMDLIAWKGLLAGKINALVYGSGVSVDVMGAIIEAIGIPWFLIVLFLGRSLFDYLHLRLKNERFEIAIAVCTLVGVALGYLQWLPLSADIALAVLPFFYIGNRLKSFRFDRKAYLGCVVSFCVWGVTLILCYITNSSYLELACRRYTLFPISYISAVAGTMFVSYFSVLIDNTTVSKLFRHLGRHSLYMIWIHTIVDPALNVIWLRTDSNIVNGFFRMALDVILLIMLTSCIGIIRKTKQKRAASAPAQ